MRVVAVGGDGNAGTVFGGDAIGGAEEGDTITAIGGNCGTGASGSLANCP